MADVQAHRSAGPASSQQLSRLLQLPQLVLDLVLQKLNKEHLASLAASCSKLSVTIPAVITQITLLCRDSEGAALALASLSMWLERHNSSNRLVKLTHCRVYCTSSPNWFPPHLDRLPCTHLRHLKLRDMSLQLEPANGCPGVLQDCTALTALDLERCTVTNARAAFAAIAALPELQHLRLDGFSDGQQGYYLVYRSFGKLQYPLQLKYLEVHPCGIEPVPFTADCLSQLPALVNLEHLDLEAVASELPGSLPSQLVKLTCLRVHYECEVDIAEQFQHLSCFTALQRLGIGCDRYNVAVAVPDVRQLSQLTSLELTSSALQFNTSSASGLASLTALHRLNLEHCRVQPAAVAALTQLRALRLRHVQALRPASFEEVLLAVSKLTLLTELRYFEDTVHPIVPPAPAAAFTALKASTNLCSLELLACDADVTSDWVLFRPGLVYPYLRSIVLHCFRMGMPVSEQQLQQLCSCCPAVESLELRLSGNASRTACLPLLQLSAVTQLHVGVWRDIAPAAVVAAVEAIGGGPRAAAAVAEASAEAVKTAAAAAAALVDVAAQLPGLKHLVLEGHWLADRTAVLQLTALTALQELELIVSNNDRLSFWSKARWCSPPDVWIQLLRYLLRDAACRQTLLRCTAAAAAAPAQLMLAQLAATLAEELAGIGQPPV